jgi:hypothetical protein
MVLLGWQLEMGTKQSSTTESSVAAISRRRERIFYFVTLILTLLAIELLSRGVFAVKSDWNRRINCAPAWRISWVNRHRQGVEVYRPGIDQFDPMLGWKSRPGFRNTSPIHGSREVSTNSKGVRGRTEYSYERTRKKRIVVIGDSFAFGWGVSDHETYAALLEASLPETEVINLGIGGYGTDQMLLMLMTEGLKYQPDLVVVGIVSADSDRNVVEFRDFAKPLFVLDDGTLRLTGTPIRPPEEWLEREPWRPKSLDLLIFLGSYVEGLTSARQHRVERITWELWDEIDRVTRQAGARTLFVFAPFGGEIENDVPGSGEKLIARFATEEGVDLLNLGSEFRRRRQEGNKFRRGHWGPYGHSVIARALKHQILHEDLLDRRSAEHRWISGHSARCKDVAWTDGSLPGLTRVFSSVERRRWSDRYPAGLSVGS